MRKGMFEIQRIGCDSVHDGNFLINRQWGKGFFLILFIKTKAYVTFNGVEQLVEPNTLVLFNECTPHIYRACGDTYVNDWAQFSVDSKIVENMSLPFDSPVFVGDTIPVSAYFQLISDCFFSNSPLKEQTCSLLLNALLNMLSDFGSQDLTYSQHYSSLLKIRHSIYQNPETQRTMSSIAEQLHLSTAYFQEIYRKTFGVTCGSDIIKSRVENAKDLLMYSSLTVGEIAEKCGYNSNVHFSRQFKASTGLSPKAYRNAK